MNMKLFIMLAAAFTLACGSDDDSSETVADNAAAESVTDTPAMPDMPVAGDATAAEQADETSGAADTGECGTVHMVTTTDDTSDIDAYMDFAPADITISVGDCIEFVMSRTHNAVEVSQETYESRGFTALEEGFSVSYGETERVRFDEAGTHYYICVPHVGADMVGTITVE